MTLEKMTVEDEIALDALLANQTIAPPSRALFERIVASAPQPNQSMWQQLSAWFNFRVAGIGLATAMAGALCVTVWSTNLTIDDATSTADNVGYEQDYGQDWIG